MSKKKDFYRDLAMSESSNDKKARDKETGFIGLYQLGESSLVDVCYYYAKHRKPWQQEGAQYNNDWTSGWVGKNGINSLDEFLNNELVQNIAVREYHQKVWFYLRNYHFYENKEVGGILLTKSAMLAGAHSASVPAVMAFINSEGKIDESDKNLVLCSKYMMKFTGYEVDYEVDELIKAFNNDLEFPAISCDLDNRDNIPQLFEANKVINKQVTKLLSNPSDFKEYQQRSLNNAFEDLKLAECLVPNITKTSLESMGEHYEFLQQLTGIKDPTSELEKIKKLEEEEEKIEPYLKNLVESVQKQQTFSDKGLEKLGTQKQKTDREDNDWLNALLSNTKTMMNEASNDPDMQQFIQNLGNGSKCNFDDYS